LLPVPEDRWRFEVTRRGLAPLSALLPEAEAAEDDLDGWLDREDYLYNTPAEIDQAVTAVAAIAAGRKAPRTGPRIWRAVPRSPGQAALAARPG
jgi:hypothetical protein